MRLQGLAALGRSGSLCKGRGKRGGARVVYYYLDDTFPIYALLAYPKNAKTDLTSDEKKAVKKFVTALKATRKAKK